MTHPDHTTNTYEGFCMKCRAKRQFIGVIETSPKRNRYAKGACPVCGTTIARAMGRAPRQEDTPPAA